MTPAERERQAESARLSEAVIARWRMGKGTAQIASDLKMKEPAVCRIIHTWFDLRWQMKANIGGVAQ